VASPAFQDFPQVLAGVAQETERLLDEVLGLQGSAAPRLTEAMRHAVLGGGKRLRPLLVMASSRLFEVSRISALRTGAALECIHSYSLVHDDLPAMDNDDLRRGKPTVHKAFGEATAILAGDSLQTLAFEILSHPETHSDPGVRAELVLELARAAGKEGMAGGQMLDLLAEQQPVRQVAEIERLQLLKTGALLKFACEAGAILGRGDRAALRRYGQCIGLAFQLADDILDVESTSEMLGKATQKDHRIGKATFVELLGLEGAKAKARQLAEEADAALSSYDERADLLRAAARFIVLRRS
jgi:farnesyl diphosphate synthase